MEQIDPVKLQKLIAKHFNDAELRELCFELGVDFEELPGERKSDKARELVELYRRQRRLEQLAEVVLGKRPHIEPHTFIRDTRIDQSPFKGLQYFEEDDAHLFFGREALTAKLVEHLRDNRFLAVVGASGSGKSSLVRAGLIPTLRGRSLATLDVELPPGSPSWPVYVLTPTAHPLKELATRLTRDAESIRATTVLMDDMADDPRSLDIAISKLVAETTADRALIVADQFEELFTLCHDEAERQALVDNLVYAVAPETAGPTTVVLSLRADFYNHCLQYESLHALLEEQQKIVGPMTPEELRQAIELPAQHDGLRIERALVNLLLRDISMPKLKASEEERSETGKEEKLDLIPEPGALPLLSHVLLETWRRREGNRLTLAGYTAAGGAHGAIAKTAETISQGFSPEQQQIARNIFVRLTELGEDTQDTRRRARLEELKPDAADAEQVAAVLKKLADARLVTTHEDAAEVAHEALIREWPALRHWLDENREGLRLHRQLTETALAWDARNHDDSYLYRGAQLEAVNKRTDVMPLTRLEQAFLAASQSHYHDELAQAEARAQREADAAHKLRQQAVFLKVALLAVGLLTIASFLVLVQSEKRRVDAVSAEARAVANAWLAVTRAAEAYYARIEAEDASTEAERQRRLALSHSLAALSPRLLDEPGNDTELATLLAIEAARINGRNEGDVEWLVDSALRSLLSKPFHNNVLPGHSSRVLSVALSPDGRWLASGSADQTIRLWDINQPGIESAVLHGHEASVLSVAFSPDGRWLATGSADQTIRLWSMSQLEARPMVLRGHEAVIWTVAFNPDGRWLASGSEDQTVRLWDVTNPEAEPVVLQEHEARVLSVALSPDGRWLASGSEDQTVRLWDMSQLEAGPVVLKRHEAIVWTVAFSPDGRWLASGSEDQMVWLWDMGQLEAEPVTLRGHGDWVLSVAFSPDGRWLASGSADRTVRLWDVGQPKAEPIVLRGPRANVLSVAFSPGGRWLASGGEDGIVQLWNVNQLEAEPVMFQGHGDRVWSVAFSLDGQKLASGSADQTVRLWDMTQSGTEPVVLPGHESSVTSVAFSPDGQKLVSGSTDQMVRLWDVGQPEAEPVVLRGHEDWVWSVAFSPDGQKLASGSADQTVRLWDMGQLEAEPVVLSGHYAGVLSVAFSPDGRWLASGSDNHTVQLWDVNQLGAEPVVLRGHEARILSVAFSPDGRWLASGSSDQAVRLWDVSQPETEPVVLRAYEARVLSVAFSPDGRWLASASEDQTVQLSLLLDALIEISCSVAQRNFTWEEWQRYLPGEPYRQTCPNLPVHPSVPQDQCP